MTEPTLDPGAVPPSVPELDTIVGLGERRRLIFPSSEICGGINAVSDYGPLGVELKSNVERAWGRTMVESRDDIVGLDSGIRVHPQIWVASGHVAEFNDPMVECGPASASYRVDEFAGAEDLGPAELLDTGVVADSGWPVRTTAGRSARQAFNLMLETFLGPAGRGSRRLPAAETAGHVRELPQRARHGPQESTFGIAQVGKASTTRSAPATSSSGCGVRADGDADLVRRRRGGRVRGLAPAPPRLVRGLWRGAPAAPFPGGPTRRLAHYAKKAVNVSTASRRFEGARGNQIGAAGTFAGARRSPARTSSTSTRRPGSTPSRGSWRPRPARTGRPHLPDRRLPRRGGPRREAVVLGLHPDLAPYKVAVLPLLKKRREIVELCHRIKEDLKRHAMAVYDDTAAIGKLYRRQDEIGTPWCVTVDVDSLDDRNVTVRDRDAIPRRGISADQVTRYVLGPARG